MKRHSTVSFTWVQRLFCRVGRQNAATAPPGVVWLLVRLEPIAEERVSVDHTARFLLLLFTSRAEESFALSLLHLVGRFSKTKRL